jgi:hypothetical protein
MSEDLNKEQPLGLPSELLEKISTPRFDEHI